MYGSLWMVFIIVLLLGALAQGQANELDDYIRAQMAHRHIPGLSLAVVKDGKVLVTKGYGTANLELHVPVTPETVFEIGSLTKPFTAIALMMLVEQGKIRLEDRLTQYIEGLPSGWSTMTLRHLLTHTAGLKGHAELPDFDLHKDYSEAEFVRFFASKPLAFQPGEQWAYSSTGFNLAAMVIAKVSGLSYEEYVALHILRPLGMTQTRFKDAEEIVSQRADGYRFDPQKQWRKTDPFRAKVLAASGGLLSTAVDLAKWEAALDTAKLLKRSSLDSMWTPATLSNGQATHYGLGWFLGAYRGHPIVWHSGLMPGFSCILSRFVDEHLTVIVLCNLRGITDTDALARGIARIYIPSLSRKELKAKADPDPATTQRLKAVVTDLLTAHPDLTPFTPEIAAFFAADSGKAALWAIAAHGVLHSFTFLDRKQEKQSVQYQYRMEIGPDSLYFTLVLTPEGKIGGISYED